MIDEIDIDGLYHLEVFEEAAGFSWTLKDLRKGRRVRASSSLTKREALAQALQAIQLKEAILARRNSMTQEPRPTEPPSQRVDSLMQELTRQERKELLRKLFSDEGVSLTFFGSNHQNGIQLNFFGNDIPEPIIDAICSRIREQTEPQQQ